MDERASARSRTPWTVAVTVLVVIAEFVLLTYVYNIGDELGEIVAALKLGGTKLWTTSVAGERTRCRRASPPISPLYEL